MGLPTKLHYEWRLSSIFFSQVLERYELAEALLQEGRDHEALHWFSSFDNHSTYDLVADAPAHFKRGEVYARLGDTVEAKRQYARFIELWKSADPALQPMVAEARRRLVVP
jgi:tetratricopeptide (TPR) repeat protein